MKRFPFAIAATMMAFTVTLNAQGPKAGTVGATKAHVGTPSPKSAAASAPKGSTKSTSSGQSASHKPADASNGHSKSAKTTSTSTSTSDSTGTSTGTTAAAEVVTPNAVSMKIEKNPAQLARAMDFLGPLGLTLEEGTAGFRNQGQFIAAMNASKNRGISFVDLQQAMTVDGLSLGQAAKKILNTPPAPEAPAGDSTTSTGTTGTGTTGTTGTGTTGTGTTGGTQ